MEDSKAPPPIQKRQFKGNSNLPNMFKQQESRQQEFIKKRESSLGCPVMNKKVFTGFLDKFEDERGRLEAKVKMQQLILAQKEKQRSAKKLEDLEEEKRSQVNQVKKVEEQAAKHESSIRKEEVHVLKSKAEEGKKERISDENALTIRTVLPKHVDATSVKAKMQQKIQEQAAYAKRSSQLQQQLKPVVQSLVSNPFEQRQINGDSPELEVSRLNEVKKKLCESDTRSLATDMTTSNMSGDPSRDGVSGVTGGPPLSTASTMKQERKSKEQMQNYLLTHLLFDDPLEQEVPKRKNSIDKLFEELVSDDVDPSHLAELEEYMATMDEEDERPPPPPVKEIYRPVEKGVKNGDGDRRRERRDSIDELFESLDPVAVDPEYVRQLESYYMVLHEDKKSPPESSKKSSGAKIKLKIVEINNIKNRFEKCAMEGDNNITPSPVPRSGSSSAFDNQKGKVKGFFDSNGSVDNNRQTQPKPTRRGKLLNTDLLNKFNSPEMAEQVKRQQDQEREERRLSRIAKLEEERRRQEELEAMERHRLLEEERLRIAYEAMLREEQERADARKKREQELKKRREQIEPQLKKKKVLDRFQHMFDPKPGEKPCGGQKQVGQLRADGMFADKNEEEEERRVFQDPALTGVSQMVHKMRNKLDGKDSSKPVAATKRAETKNTLPKASLTFQLKEKQQQPGACEQSLGRREETQWSWKAKQAVREQQSEDAHKSSSVAKAVLPLEQQKTTSNVTTRLKNREKADTADFKTTSGDSETKNKVIVKVKVKVNTKPKKKLEQIPKATESCRELDPRQGTIATTAVKQLPDSMSKSTVKHVMDNKLGKSTSEGEKKQKCISELLQLLSNNSHLLPQNVKNKLQAVRAVSLGAHQTFTDGLFLELRASLGEYINSPDKSSKEIDFKSEVERQLGLLAAWEVNVRVATAPEAPQRKSVTRDTKHINDCTNRIIQELSRPDNVESICIPKIAGAPKRKFHDKCIQLQKCLNALSGNVDGGGEVKSLEEIKAETESKQWKWKDMQLSDMQQYMKSHNKELPSQILEKQKRLKEFGQVLEEKETAATNRRDAEEIKRIREHKDVEFEAFIREVRDYVDQTESKQTEFKQGIQDYLALIEDGPGEKPSLYDKSAEKTGSFNFNARRKMLQKNFEGESGVDSPKVVRNWTVRKAVDLNGGDEGLSLRPIGTCSRSRSAASLKNGVKPSLMDKKFPRSVDKDDWSNIHGITLKSKEEVALPFQRELRKKGVLRDQASKTARLPTESDDRSTIKDVKTGLCNNLRSVFESGSSEQIIPVPIPRSRSCANMKSVFERESPPPVLSRQLPESTRNVGLVSQTRKALFQESLADASRRFQINDEERSSESSASLRRKFEAGLVEAATSEDRPGLALGKSPSFSKFRDAFESGIEGVDAGGQKPTKITGVKAELEALKQCPRLQNLLRINKPKESKHSSTPLSRSKTTSSMDLDDKTVASVSRSKAAIKSIFESSAPKVTFGEGLKKSSTAPVSGPPKEQKKKAAAEFTERKWVFDTINKYFDVIKEDLEEEDEEGTSDADRLSSTYSSQVSCSNTTSNRSSMALSPSPSASSANSCLVKRFQESTTLQKSQSTSKVVRGMLPQVNSSGKAAPARTSPATTLVRSQSSSKLREMVAAIARSRSNIGIDKFKENLGSHLKLRASTESLNSGVTSPYSSRKISTNLDPGVNDDSDCDNDLDDEEDYDEVTFDNPRYTRVKL